MRTRTYGGEGGEDGCPPIPILSRLGRVTARNELRSWKERAKSRDLSPASALLGFFLRFPRRPACRLFLGGFLGRLLLSRPPGSFLGSFLLRFLGGFLLSGGLAGTASSARRGWSRSGSSGSRCRLRSA